MSHSVVDLMNENADLKVTNGALVEALTQFVAACDTAPPTSFVIEIGMACTTARAALALAKGE